MRKRQRMYLLLAASAVLIAVALLLLSARPAETQFPGNRTTLANPASVYCAGMGYTVKIVAAPDGGQMGICVFPDGNECEEWGFYRGECGGQYRK
ncbi:MAG: DUF333 domain-containing protein [Candidatus Aenigmatarchaeota archaeon]